MTENSKIPPAKKTIEDPPEYSAATGEGVTWSGRGKPPEAEPQQDLRGQLKWNERSGESEAAPTNSDAVTPANSPPASEATMRYNPRYSAKDRAQEDRPVTGDPINQADPTGQSSDTSTKAETVTSGGHVASGGVGGIKDA